MQRIQHPSNNDVLGPPKGSNIAECNALPITRVHFEDGSQAVTSYWRPSSYEIELIMQGHPVRLTIIGSTHAPVKLSVAGDGEDY